MRIKILFILIVSYLITLNDLLAQQSSFSKVREKMIYDKASFENLQTLITVYSMEKCGFASKESFWQYFVEKYNARYPLQRLLKQDSVEQICQNVFEHEIKPRIEEMNVQKKKSFVDKQTVSIILKISNSKIIKMYYLNLVKDFNNYNTDKDINGEKGLMEQYYNDYLNGYYININTY